MNKEIAQLWTEALRSGKYEQCRLRLNNSYDGSHCCLGVLCEIMISEGGNLVKHTNTAAGTTTYNGEEFGLPETVMKWSGISSKHGEFTDSEGNYGSLALMNDDHDVSFCEIAKIIDQYGHTL